MRKIAVFIKSYSIGKSSPVICMLDLLSDNYEIDLFLQNVEHSNVKMLKKSNINIITINGEDGNRILNKIRQLFAFFVGENNNKNKYRNYVADDNYVNHICFDPHAFLLCKKLFPQARPIYYSLELYLKNDHFNLNYPENVMNEERSEINNIKGLIIQSSEREAIFRKEYNLSSQIPTFLLPVTYLQPSVKEKSTMIRKKYNIDRNKMIALHLGGIQEYFSCIELAVAFSKLDNWMLIFHGYHFGDYIEKLRKTIAINNIKNVFISDELYEQIEEMDPLLMSCDIGIAWYNDVSINFTTGGKSSGKISAYLRFGLPIIAKKYNSTVEAIENTGCGVCVDDFNEIKDAVSKIEKNYDFYSDNCRKEYDKVYWFENYRKGLINFIER